MQHPVQPAQCARGMMRMRLDNDSGVFWEHEIHKALHNPLNGSMGSQRALEHPRTGSHTALWFFQQIGSHPAPQYQPKIYLYSTPPLYNPAIPGLVLGLFALCIGHELCSCIFGGAKLPLFTQSPVEGEAAKTPGPRGLGGRVQGCLRGRVQGLELRTLRGWADREHLVFRTPLFQLF